MKFTIRIKKDSKSGWLTGQCEQLPEAISQGKDLEELMLMMEDAITLVLECKRDEFREQLVDKNTTYILSTSNKEKDISATPS